MNRRQPYRPRPVAAPIAPPGYYYPTPVGHPVYVPLRRGPSRFWAFLQGYLISLALGGGLACLVAASLILIFPPRRTNILLLGVDRRPDEHTMVTRTDTLLLVTVSPPNRYVGMLSIPRDLYVTLPNNTLGRINTAHFFAEAEQPGSGPEAAMNTVRSNFGVDVHNYARVDLVGFVRIVDALGGVEIDVPAPLIDYEYPTYDYGTQVVEFQAGRQHMSGEQALAYARIRHGSSDFQRAERQQRVLQAIFARLLQPGAWLRLPLVFAAVNASVDTDLTVVDALRLAPTVLLAGPARLDHRVIEGGMVEPYTTDGGGLVMLPVWERINPVLFEMFGQ